MAKWQEVVGTVAPTIATALGGPLAGLAVGAIGKIFGLDAASEEQVANAIAGASPDDLLKLKQAEIEFKQRMAELDVDLERIAAGDRDSARQREAATHDWTPRLLAIVIVSGWLAVQYFLLMHLVPTEMRDIIMRMLGVLDMALGAVLNYYFGSSASSAKKTELLAAAGVSDGR